MKIALVAAVNLAAMLGKLLVNALTWFGSGFASLFRKLTTQPIRLAVRVHVVVFAILLIAFTLADAWDKWHRLIVPLIHGGGSLR